MFGIEPTTDEAPWGVSPLTPPERSCKVEKQKVSLGATPMCLAQL